MRNSLHRKSLKKSIFFALFTLLLILTILPGCKKNNIVPELSPSGQADSARPLSDSTESTIINGDFTEWDPVSHAPSSWILQASYGDAAVISRTENGLKFERNASGSFYLYQKVLLQKKNFFKVSVTVDYTINDYSPCGIYAIDSSRNKMLGKFERSNSSGKEVWEFVFYAKKDMEITIVIGFLNGINAKATFSNASISKYTYQPQVSGSDFSTYLNNKLSLLFSPSEYDSSISKIADYLNGVLLSKKKFHADTVELPILNNLIGSNPAYFYFNQYLQNTPNEIIDSYCQKSSLSLEEILTNEFNIPVRQIYMNFAGVGKHQFLEYWNPFIRNWIIIDPCFNCRYRKENKLLGIDDLDSATAVNYYTRFGVNYYYKTTDDLTTLWQTMDELVVSDYNSLTFPY